MENVFDKLLSPHFLSSVAVVILAIALYIAIGVVTDRAIKKRRESGKVLTVSRVILRIFQIVVLLFGLMLVLQINGINITAMLAGLGIVSAIVGLALQDYLKDLVMGIYILVDHFFSLGECVSYDGREGVILDMSLKTTKIGDLDDHSVLTICNRNILEIRRLGERMDVDIPLSYQEDPKTVSQVLSEVCDKLATLDAVNACEFKGTQSFESSAILYRIRVFCQPAQRADVRRSALTMVQNQLNNYGIAIPFNQLDVHCDITNN